MEGIWVEKKSKELHVIQCNAKGEEKKFRQDRTNATT